MDRLRRGDQHILSRLISLVEDEADEVPTIMREIYPHTGKATVVGFTGPPGAGKSSLIDQLTSIARAEGRSTGIIVVDPTSPFSGGAVLGDRIRMQRHYLDEGVFIRSMATRGNPGGLPVACHNVIRLLDAAGKDLVFVETVGVGQTELDIMDMADTVVVVLVPESGDSIQTMKAGLLEIADIFAVNKADRPGASHLTAELRTVVHTAQHKPWWDIPVLETQAINGTGVQELWAQIGRHAETLRSSGHLTAQRRLQREKEFRRILSRRLAARAEAMIEGDEKLAAALDQVATGAIDPYSASDEIISRHLK